MTKTTTPQSPTRLPWNRGRIIGPKPPLKPKHIWAIRTRLQHDGHIRDLAMFNVAIDSKLRGCDLVKLRVTDVHLGDGVRLRTTIVQQKTRSTRSVRDDRADSRRSHGLAEEAGLAIGRLAVSEPEPRGRPHHDAAVRPARRTHPASTAV